MVWWILILALLLLLTWLLIAPLELIVNSDENRYLLRYKGFAEASIRSDDQELFICRLKALGWRRDYYPLRMLSKSKEPDSAEDEQAKKKGKSSRWKPSWQQIKALFREIEIKELRIDLDTGNWATNAQLYPVFWWMNRTVGEWQVNFEHRNAISVYLRTRPYRLIKAMFNP